MEANQYVELSTSYGVNDFNNWTQGNTVPIVEFTSNDGNFNVWNLVTPVVDMTTQLITNQTSMLIQQYSGGNEMILVNGLFVETGSYSKLFTLKSSGNLTARFFVETTTY